MPPSAFRRQPGPAAGAVWFAGAAGQALLASEADMLMLAAQEKPGQPALWLAPLPLQADTDEALILRLHAVDAGFAGDVRSGLPFPLASESCGVVVLQHLADIGTQPLPLLQECARVLVPGGRLWLLGLNPLSPYRLRWRGQGPRAAEPVLWRRRLRAVGLAPEPVSQGLGPTWAIAPTIGLQDGAGLRAAFLLRAEKRRTPLTPLRAKPRLHWQTEPVA